MVYFLLLTATLTAIIAARYLVLSGLAHWLLWGRGGERLNAVRLNRERPMRRAIREEVRLSLIASGIHAPFVAVAMMIWWRYDGTQVYSNVSDYGWPYLFLSFFIYLIIQDTYYYWAHRAMHHPRLFRVMHAGHHHARHPTPFSSFAFDPAEAVVTAWLLPVMVFLIPIHIGALLALVTVMTVASILNHSGWEVFPRAFVNGMVGRQLITATHHSHHHIRFNANYGLYFRFWDRLMGTDSMAHAHKPAHRNVTLPGRPADAPRP
ncbi:MAG: sterol desaturase family protein [Chitinophagales bacterium]|nr:sterol desaturase family protein [Hyphomicrobiales bacterium]